MKQVLPPGVKDGEKADLSAEMFGIGGDSLERFGRGAEENTVEDALVLEGDGGNLFGHGEDNVEIAAVEQLFLPVGQPLGASQGLALRTMTVRTRVVPDALLAAPVTDFDMTTKHGGTADLDRGHDAALRHRHQGAKLFAVGLAVAAEDLRQLQFRALHERSGQGCG